MTDATVRRVVIVPSETELTAPYWEAARRGAVGLQRCGPCGHVWHPPQPACPQCRSTDIAWFDASGFGTVHAYTVVHQSAHPAVAGRTPYTVALVELAEGPRFVCNVLDCSPDLVTVGMPVRIAAGEAPAGATLPQAFVISGPTISSEGAPA